MLSFLLWLSVLLAALPAWSATYYVATNGTGSGCVNGGQATNQMRNTITGGIGCLAAGDTLLVKNGTYTEGINGNSVPNGSTGVHTIVKAETIRGAILRPAAGTNCLDVNGNKHFLTFDGFACDRTGQAAAAGGMDINAQNGLSDLLLANWEIFGIKADDVGTDQNFLTTSGIGASWPTSNVIFRNVYVHDIGTNCNGGGCCNECYGYGIYLSGSGYTIENSEFANTSGWIVHGYTSGTGASNNIVRNTYFHDSGGPVLLCQSTNQIYNNVLARLGTVGRQYPSGILLNDPGGCSGKSGTGNLIAYNTLYQNAGACVNLGGATNGTTRNNICYQNGSDTIANGGGGNSASNNLLGTNPLLVNPGAGDFHLQSGSPALDNGLCLGSVTTDRDGDARPQPPGGSCDIGADEFAGAPPPVAPELIAWWKLDEGTGTTASDATGHGYTGTLSGGPAWVGGRVGPKALSLDGVDDRVTIPSLLSQPSAVTIVLWVRAISLGGNNRAELLSLGDAVALTLQGSALYAFYFTGSTWVDITTPILLFDSTWHHLVFVCDPLGGVQRLYIDGTLRTTTTDTRTISYSGVGATTVLGAHGNGDTDKQLNGSLDDVRVYNYALSAGEVTALYRAASTQIRHRSQQR